LAPTGKQLLYRGYKGQEHAYCIYPQLDYACFMDVVSVMVNGTLPPSTV
jgi:hypothetical protein